MSQMEEEKKVSYDLLKKYGAKWAVLAAMEADLTRKGIVIPDTTNKEIQMSHAKISSGCFSPCDANCDLTRIEADLVSQGAALGDEYMDQWFDLMGEAMSGTLGPEKISEIPVLKPIDSLCGFLKCTC
ncbi:MAG: hypothetical protein QG657_506 [Acidobacteriota bacterium]|nr:hypothetical protein [Acidobacteriota bacterium]